MQITNEQKKRYELTPVRMAHFMANCDHESQGFTKLYENLNYSAERLLKVFPKYFTPSIAKSVERNPEKIGNIIYGGRLCNKPDEGYKYRGRGYLQITGKYNYQKFSEFIKDDCVTNPDLIAEKYALESALWFFTVNRIWQICDYGTSRQTIEMVRRKVNGGLLGIDDVINKFNKYYNEYRKY